MRAAVIHSFDKPPVMQEVPEPTAGPDEVIINVKAAAVHPLIRAIASGKHYASPKKLPAVLGADGVGVTQAGEHVYFGPLRPPMRAMAERVAVPRALCTPIPKNINAAAVASLMNPGAAALLPLRWRAKLQPGQSVCILGATGAAGQLAVRLARILGAGKILAVGRRQDVLEGLRKHGATDTLALEPGVELAAAFADKGGPDGFDVVIDYLFGTPVQSMIDCIAKHKYAKDIHIVQVGEMAGPVIQVTGAVLRSTGLILSGFGLRATGLAPRPVEVEAINQLMGWVEADALSVEHKAIAIEQLEATWQQTSPRLVVTF